MRVAVIETEGAWRLFLNDERMGRFSSRRAAVSCALDVARETRRDGALVEVLAQDRFGEITVAQSLASQPAGLAA